MLQVSGIDAWYGNVQVLRGLSLSVAAGEVLCMLGRNGAGKTTALKAIMGLVRPRSGSIRPPCGPCRGAPSGPRSWVACPSRMAAHSSPMSAS